MLLAAPPAFRPLHLEAAVNAGKHIFARSRLPLMRPDCVGLCSGQKAESACRWYRVCWRPPSQAGDIQARTERSDREILTVEATYNTGELWYKDRQQGWSDMEYKLRNWLYYNWLSGDHIVEQAIHSLDMLSGEWATSCR